MSAAIRAGWTLRSLWSLSRQRQILKAERHGDVMRTHAEQYKIAWLGLARVRLIDDRRAAHRQAIDKMVAVVGDVANLVFLSLGVKEIGEIATVTVDAHAIGTDDDALDLDVAAHDHVAAIDDNV